MVKVKFVGMLVGLLFLVNVLRDYYAVAHQDDFLGIQHSDDGRNHDNSFPMVASSAIADQVITPQKNHKELGGRKMVVAKKKKNKADHDDDDDHNLNTAAYHKKLRYLKQAAFPAAAASSRAKSGRKVGATAGDGDDERLLEATRKIVALMHKDYKGMNKPKRKPPINNNLPVH
ncbi:unnamed protein product [Linum trigynum]|uniref:Uncharacterized protein n=1 Tax=Linum trigynum TaxID=586398 RepID=A0AAV2F314_9ROSI